MEPNSEKRVIEINGVKLEVDLRHAKRIDEFRVGDRIKLLKKRWQDSWESFVGIIAGFDDFPSRPSVTIAYITDSALEFLTFNKDSKDVEICAAYDTDLPLKKGDVLRRMEAEMDKKRAELRDLEDRKNYFLQNFGRFFEPSEQAKMA